FPPQPAGVDREQEQREDEREDHVRRLTDRAHHRTPREQQHLVGERPVHAGSIARPTGGASSSSLAPSSERPVFARKTSSSEGWWSSSCSTSTSSASSARTTSARSAPGRRRTATPFGEG